MNRDTHGDTAPHAAEGLANVPQDRKLPAVTSSDEPGPELKRPPWYVRFAQHRAAFAGSIVLVIFVVLAILAPWITTHDPITGDMYASLEGPSAEHWLGTDQLGRDVLTRLIFGTRISLLVAGASVLISAILGIPLGVWCGYRGGWIDLLVQRVVDIFQAFPGILMALLVAALFGQNLVWITVAFGVVHVPVWARLIRGQVLEVKARPYVDAARSLGYSNMRILARHVVPNCMSPAFVQATLQFAFAILTLAGLGFLGLGARPPTPEWGAMLGEGRSYLISDPLLVIFPSAVIVLFVASLNLVGDGLRDAFDPRSVAT